VAEQAMATGTTDRDCDSTQSDVDAYKKLVIETAELAKRNNREILQFYYEIGERVSLLDDGRSRTYGQHSVEQFGKDSVRYLNDQVQPEQPVQGLSLR
jgi:hypothetical protein